MYFFFVPCRCGLLTAFLCSRYPISQATWTPGGNLDGAPQAFDQFLADAKAEGIDIPTKGLVLLEEARGGGWEA